MVRRGSRLLLLFALGLAAALAAAWSLNTSQPQAGPVQLASVTPATADRIQLTPAQRREAAAKDASLGKIRSLINIPAPLSYGEYVWNEKHVPAGPVWIRIDLIAQTISAFRGGHEIGTAVILYGTDGMETPRGQLAVLAKSKDHHSRQYDAPMPYSLWLTKDGVAIHGSDVRWGSATHGCVGVPLKFAEKLFGATKVGDPVIVIG